MRVTIDRPGRRNAVNLPTLAGLRAAFEQVAADDAMAARLVASPREALAGIKAGLRRGETSDLAGALAFEAERQDACFHSPDFTEGVAAFLGKRPPRYGA